ncbi:sulfatase [Mycobacteroides abscessus subsp. massiliense]|nr:sulfatase [Mycobacteroides abscessus subsp. massiliense]MBN7425467.1 sulfatase [Mycobacteroides abscessus subsp. massiliense]MBN7466866.1 sulfatase [Mycobacteroides abscessus subsp. massiliense]MBN7509533.1 sulfatase [Mycobacteroides abscessus subsp. massiliense]MBN7526525.1 sulfatase [Mycobacteroides abscessus subsp. massiliense]
MPNLIGLRTRRPQHPVPQRWFDEAAKHNGLPLTDLNILETMTRWRPYLAGERTSFTYYPNSAAAGLGAMVEIRGQSFSILAEVTTKPAAQGVIFKQGGAHGGHVLFIDEQAVGALRDVEIHPGTFGLAGASLSIGRNGGSAVSSDYPAPYPFTGGAIAQVVVDISGEAYENLEKKLAIAFAKD